MAMECPVMLSFLFSPFFVLTYTDETSLTQYSFECGDIVSYFLHIDATQLVADSPYTITVVLTFTNTAQVSFANVDDVVLVSSRRAPELVGSASVTYDAVLSPDGSFWTVTLEVSGIDAGDILAVQTDLELGCTGVTGTGTLAGSITSATIIKVGNQAVEPPTALQVGTRSIKIRAGKVNSTVCVPACKGSKICCPNGVQCVRPGQEATCTPPTK